MTKAEVRRGLLEARSPRDVVAMLEGAGRTPLPGLVQVSER
jgi:hypothetical protein